MDLGGVTEVAAIFGGIIGYFAENIGFGPYRGTPIKIAFIPPNIFGKLYEFFPAISDNEGIYRKDNVVYEGNGKDVLWIGTYTFFSDKLRRTEEFTDKPKVKTEEKGRDVSEEYKRNKGFIHPPSVSSIPKIDGQKIEEIADNVRSSISAHKDLRNAGILLIPSDIGGETVEVLILREALLSFFPRVVRYHPIICGFAYLGLLGRNDIPEKYRPVISRMYGELKERYTEEYGVEAFKTLERYITDYPTARFTRALYYINNLKDFIGNDPQSIFGLIEDEVWAEENISRPFDLNEMVMLITIINGFRRLKRPFNIRSYIESHIGVIKSAYIKFGKNFPRNFMESLDSLERRHIGFTYRPDYSEMGLAAVYFIAKFPSEYTAEVSDSIFGGINCIYIRRTNEKGNVLRTGVIICSEDSVDLLDGFFFRLKSMGFITDYFLLPYKYNYTYFNPHLQIRPFPNRDEIRLLDYITEKTATDAEKIGEFGFGPESRARRGRKPRKFGNVADLYLLDMLGFSAYYGFGLNVPDKVPERFTSNLRGRMLSIAATRGKLKAFGDLLSEPFPAECRVLFVPFMNITALKGWNADPCEFPSVDAFLREITKREFFGLLVIFTEQLLDIAELIKKLGGKVPLLPLERIKLLGSGGIRFGDVDHLITLFMKLKKIKYLFFGCKEKPFNEWLRNVIKFIRRYTDENPENRRVGRFFLKFCSAITEYRDFLYIKPEEKSAELRNRMEEIGKILRLKRNEISDYIRITVNDFLDKKRIYPNLLRSLYLYGYYDLKIIVIRKKKGENNIADEYIKRFPSAFVIGSPSSEFIVIEVFTNKYIDETVLEPYLRELGDRLCLIINVEGSEYLPLLEHADLFVSIFGRNGIYGEKRDARRIFSIKAENALKIAESTLRMFKMAGKMERVPDLYINGEKLPFDKPAPNILQIIRKGRPPRSNTQRRRTSGKKRVKNRPKTKPNTDELPGSKVLEVYSELHIHWKKFMEDIGGTVPEDIRCRSNRNGIINSAYYTEGISYNKDVSKEIIKQVIKGIYLLPKPGPFGHKLIRVGCYIKKPTFVYGGRKYRTRDLLLLPGTISVRYAPSGITNSHFYSEYRSKTYRDKTDTYIELDYLMPPKLFPLGLFSFLRRFGIIHIVYTALLKGAGYYFSTVNTLNLDRWNPSYSMWQYSVKRIIFADNVMFVPLGPEYDLEKGSPPSDMEEFRIKFAKTACKNILKIMGLKKSSSYLNLINEPYMYIHPVPNFGRLGLIYRFGTVVTGVSTPELLEKLRYVFATFPYAEVYSAEIGSLSLLGTGGGGYKGMIVDLFTHVSRTGEALKFISELAEIGGFIKSEFIGDAETVMFPVPTAKIPGSRRFFPFIFADLYGDLPEYTVIPAFNKKGMPLTYTERWDALCTAYPGLMTIYKKSRDF